MVTSNRVLTYQNVMEQLAAEEIDRQLRHYPVEVVQSVNSTEAMAYALNRLPSLYATTEEGWHWHRARAQKSLFDLIALTAKWGIQEAQQQNKRFSTPLKAEGEAEAALEKLQELLGCESLTWGDLVDVVEKRLKQPTLSVMR